MTALLVNGVVAVLAALAGGAIGSYLNRPAALAAAEQTKIKMQGRRELLKNARDMLERAARMGWTDGAILANAAGQALLAASSPEVRGLESDTPLGHGLPGPTGPSDLWKSLSAEVRRLEREWELI